MLRLIYNVLALTSAVSAAVVTTGATGGTQNRKEIRELAKSKDELDIYLQALASFQAVPQSNETSFYGIMGIHGYPGGSWDGSEGADTGMVGNGAHSSPHFMGWHRAFVVLFEQMLQRHALKVAEQYPSSKRSRYVKIAQSTRAAYWDWTQAENDTAFPDILSDKTVTVNSPNGIRTIPNPLRRYKFNPDANGLEFTPWKDALYTTRSPTNRTDLTSASQQDASRRQVDLNRAQWHDRVYKVLTNYTEFKYVSNEGWIEESDVNLQDSFEAIHDAVHGAVGGDNGHMTLTDFSSFDPTFMLHHANVDRLFAMWQALHPDSWFEPTREQTGNFWFKEGSTSTPTQGLVPFKKNQDGDYLTANDLRNWTNFGYNYPETPSDYTIASVRATIDKLYSDAQTSLITNARPQPPRAKSLRGRFFGKIEEETDEATPSNAVRDYMINFRGDKGALGKPYAIYAFLGEADEDHTKWVSSPNLIGYQTIVSRLWSKEKMEKMTPTWIAGQIPINRAIKAKIESGDIEDSSDKNIRKYLKENLSWKVVDNDGEVHNPGDIPSLSLSLASTEYSAPSESVESQGFIAALAHEGDNHRSDSPFGRPSWKSHLLDDIFSGKNGALSDKKLYRWGSKHFE